MKKILDRIRTFFHFHDWYFISRQISYEPCVENSRLARRRICTLTACDCGKTREFVETEFAANYRPVEPGEPPKNPFSVDFSAGRLPQDQLADQLAQALKTRFDSPGNLGK